jgi:hypothetical protein
VPWKVGFIVISLSLSLHETPSALFSFTGVSLEDPDYFNRDCDWSLLDFLTYRQQSSNFVSNKKIEHERYARGLQTILSSEQASIDSLRRASKALASLAVK